MFFIVITYYCVIYRRFIRVLGGIVYVNSLDYIMDNGYEYKNILNGWFVIIILDNSKRECNDCLNKSSLSPKRIYGKITSRKLGLGISLIAKRELLKFEDRVNNTKILINGANERLQGIYERALKKYGYKLIEINIKNIPQLVLTKVLE